MASLLDGVKDMMTDAVIGKVSDMVGLNASSTSSAISAFLPAILGGVINKGSSASGAGSLIDLFTKNKMGDGNLGDILGVLGDSNKSNSWMDKGSDLLGSIFGNKQSGVLDLLLGATGIKKAGGSMLMKFLAPIILNKLAGMVTGGNWGASKLSSYLGEQKSTLGSMIPGLSSVLGFAADTGSSDTTSTSSTVSSSTGGSSDVGGSSMMKWLLPLLIGAGLIWFLTKDGCSNNEAITEDNTEVSSNTDHGTTSAETATTSTTEVTTQTTSNDADGIDYSHFKVMDNGDIVNLEGNTVIAGGSYGLDENGNLVDDDGRVLIRVASIPSGMLSGLKSYLGKYAGTVLKMDDDGNLVDQAGAVIIAKGDFEERGGFYYDKQGNKLGRIWSKILKAITNSLDAMKGIFSGMLSKEAGAKTEYGLTNISFQADGHRITSFSKEEVEGLAAALKENADGKITVQAFTNDGDGDKVNKELSSNRAQVVHDMLVTLGVPKGQISFDGMGSGDNKVEIKVK